VSPVVDFRPLPTTAEEWAARLGAFDVTSDDRVAFDAWVRANPSNARDYERVSALEAIPLAFAGAPERIAHLLAEVEPRGAVAPRRRSWHVPASIAASVAMLGIAALLVPRLFDNDLSHVATRHGEQRSLTLADGSVIQLNTDTQLAYHVDSNERHVKLTSGEAFFDVAKDASRPFVVSTAVAEIHVVGTQFSVRTRGDMVDVVVKEGKVNVVPAKPALSPARILSSGKEVRVELAPGNHLRLAANNAAPRVATIDANRATAWRSGILDIDGMTLEDVVVEVNRYVSAPFVIEDDSIRKLEISGRFRVTDTESIRFMLRERLGVESVPRGEAIALRASR
jgi:transmembrane sensor